MTDALEIGPGYWTFFGVPRAIQVDDTTFVGAMPGNVSQTVVYEIDHTDRSVSTHVVDDNPPTTVGAFDDHIPAQVNLLNDGRIIASWERRSQIHYRIGDSTPSPVWGDIETIGESGYEADYSSPVDTGDRLFMFHRFKIQTNWYTYRYFESSDGGDTWSGPTTLVDTDSQWGYTSPYLDGDLIHFVVSDHPRTDQGGEPANIWYFYWDLVTDTFHEADGTQIATDQELPLDMVNDLEVVYDFDVHGDRSWFWDITVDDGTPVIAYATFPNFHNKHEYYIARWDGSSWTREKVADAGGFIEGSGDETAYSGGIAINHDDVDTVYGSVEYEPDKHRLQRFVNDGGSWQAVEAIRDGYRPEFVWDYGGDRLFDIVFWDGDYNTNWHSTADVDVYGWSETGDAAVRFRYVSGEWVGQ